MTLSALSVQLPDSVKVSLQGLTTETQLAGMMPRPYPAATR